MTRPIRLPQPYFRIHVKTVNGNWHTEDYHNLKLHDKSPNEIRKYYRDLIKYFNNTLRPNEIPRILIKVERKFEIRYKSKTVIKYIKI